MKNQLGIQVLRTEGLPAVSFWGMFGWAQNLEPLHCWIVLTLLPQHRPEEDHTLSVLMGRLPGWPRSPRLKVMRARRPILQGGSGDQSECQHP